MELSELLNQLERLGVSTQPSGDWKTKNELRAAWDIGERRVLALLHQARQHGLLEVSSKTVSTLSGRTTTVPCYRFVRPEAARSGKKKSA